MGHILNLEKYAIAPIYSTTYDPFMSAKPKTNQPQIPVKDQFKQLPDLSPSSRQSVHVPDSVLDRLAKISSGSLTTQLFKHGFRQPVMVGLKPINTTRERFAGRAFTMRFIPAREDVDTYATVTTTPNADNLQWVGVEQIQPGDVMVIDSYQDTSSASMGNMLIGRLKQRGARAVVTDGAFRDGYELSQMVFPIWSNGITATTRLSFHHVADLQVPIGCAGIAVYPGDVIHCDGDNICVVASALAEKMADLCEQQDQIEAYLALRIDAGESLWGLYPPSEATREQYQRWIEAGCPANKLKGF
jgi:regulator of RNase E activity RraA